MRIDKIKSKLHSKKNGFTIIELLLVIVIIGILAAIVALSYSGITDFVRKESFKANAQTILKKINIRESDGDGFDPLSINETNLTSQLNVDATNYQDLTVLKLKNENYLYIVGTAKFINLVACGTQGKINVYSSDNIGCEMDASGNSTIAKTSDTTPGVLGGGNGSTCALAMTIDSVEDLAWFAKDVNSGNNYSGKCIHLTLDLDLTAKNSYVNPDTTAFGDINGNGTTEGLKTELTSAAGFAPIGDSSHQFSGTFDGLLHTIYNLNINRPATSYVGLFGRNIGGRVAAINLKDIAIIGGDYTGGIAGYLENGNITESYVTGNVAGGDRVGGIIGSLYADGSHYTTSLKTNTNVTGSNNVGGLVGYAYMHYIGGVLSGINLGGNIVSVGSNIGRIVGRQDGWLQGPVLLSALAIKTAVTLNGSTATSSDNTSINGEDITSISDVNNIYVAELALDTYINGDENGDGYYWDLDGGGTLVRKNTTTDPLTFGLAGSGTTADPYLIANSTDLKQASLRLNKAYKLTADINMSGQTFYTLGSYLNRFNGNFNGNLKTISNLTINAPLVDYTGFTGFNAGGAVTALNLTNVNITGRNNTGAIAGYLANGKLTESYVTGSVTGNTSVGGIIGNLYADNSTYYMTSLRANVNVTGVDNVGGFAGYTYMHYQIAYLTGVNLGGNIVSVGSNIGRIVGRQDSWLQGPIRVTALAVKTAVTLNGSTVTSSDNTSINGADITSSDLTVQSTYEGIGFNFTDETKDYIWYMDSGVLKCREGNL